MHSTTCCCTLLLNNGRKKGEKKNCFPRLCLLCAASSTTLLLLLMIAIELTKVHSGEVYKQRRRRRAADGMGRLVCRCIPLCNQRPGLCSFEQHNDHHHRRRWRVLVLLLLLLQQHQHCGVHFCEHTETCTFLFYVRLAKLLNRCNFTIVVQKYLPSDFLPRCSRPDRAAAASSTVFMYFLQCIRESYPPSTAVVSLHPLKCMPDSSSCI